MHSHHFVPNILWREQDPQIVNNMVPIKDQLINLTKNFNCSRRDGLSSSFAFLSESPASGATFNIRFKRCER